MRSAPMRLAVSIIWIRRATTSWRGWVLGIGPSWAAATTIWRDMGGTSDGATPPLWRSGVLLSIRLSRSQVPGFEVFAVAAGVGAGNHEHAVAAIVDRLGICRRRRHMRLHHLE